MSGRSHGVAWAARARHVHTRSDSAIGHSLGAEDEPQQGAHLLEQGVRVLPPVSMGSPENSFAPHSPASDESDPNNSGKNVLTPTLYTGGSFHQRKNSDNLGYLKTPTAKNTPSFRRERRGTSPTTAGPPVQILPSQQKAPVWKNVLYEKQPFEDNYVDPKTFLVDMRKNAHFKQYNYFAIVKDMFALVQQLSITVIFVVVFVAVHGKTVSKIQMVGLNAVLLVGSLAAYIGLKSVEMTKVRKQQEETESSLALVSQRSHRGAHSSDTAGRTSASAKITSRRKLSAVASAAEQSSVDENSTNRISSRGRSAGLTSGDEKTDNQASRKTTTQHAPHSETKLAGNRPRSQQQPFKFIASSESDESVTFFGCLRQGVIFTLVLLLLAPIFRTMTLSYASDTIQALCMTLFFIHNLFTDYNYINGYHNTFEQSTAGNAALFAAVLLASRIESPAYASTLIGFGVQCFTLSPLLRHDLKVATQEGHVAVTFTLCGIAIGCLMTYSPLLASMFIVGVVSIVFVVPWAFVAMQARYKFQINGPWDEARPLNSAAAAEWARAGLLS